MKSEKSTLSAMNLKKTLWETLELLRSNNLDVNEAVAVAGLAREIIRCTSTQLKISVHSGRELPKDILDFSEK